MVGVPSDDLGGPPTLKAKKLKDVVKVKDEGSAYVFVRSNGQWSKQDKHTADDAAKYDNFGFSVSVSGDTIVAGAPNDNTGAGSIYIYAP